MGMVDVWTPRIISKLRTSMKEIDELDRWQIIKTIESLAKNEEELARTQRALQNLCRIIDLDIESAMSLADRPMTDDEVEQSRAGWEILQRVKGGA